MAPNACSQHSRIWGPGGGLVEWANHYPCSLAGEFPLYPFPHGHLAQPVHLVPSLTHILLSTYSVSNTVLRLKITKSKTDTAPFPLNGACTLVRETLGAPTNTPKQKMKKTTLQSDKHYQENRMI